jgi:AcrR family transcriptional regulator
VIGMPDRLPLAERKRRQARERIVRAADELFAEYGFDAVTVAEIADRADVGRTTFFRLFRDKQEVVFAREQELVATITAAHQASAKSAPSSLKDAIEQLRDIVLALCSQAIATTCSSASTPTFRPATP